MTNTTNRPAKVVDTASHGPEPYRVGRGRPPIETRWKKGQSGNPAGLRKKKKPQNLGEILLDEMDQPVSVKVNGGVKTVGASEAMLLNLVNQSIKGEAKALRKLMKLLDKCGLLARVEDPSHPTGVVAFSPEEDEEYRRHPERLPDLVRSARERADKRRAAVAASLRAQGFIP